MPFHAGAASSCPNCRRFGLMNQAATQLEVANHLRAGMFVVERALAKLKLPLRTCSYILDLGS